MDASDGKKNGPGRKYMSKRQRKLAAMGINEDAESAKERAASLEEARAAERRRKEEKAARAALAANARANAGAVRGKKAKLKKMKKYAEQDEEDRSLAMEVLGSAGMSKKERQAQAAREAAEAKARKEREKEERKRAYDQKLKELAGESSAAADAGAAAAPSGSRAERKAAARAEAEAERLEIDAILEEENITELSDAQREQVKEIDAFTGVATEDDVLQYAIPMCAPYSALANPKQYKFRVKLTPTGGAPSKKGRMARTAVEVFSRTAGCTDRERELMRAVSDVELTTQMIGGKLSTPGLQAVKQKQKANKKSAAKAAKGK